MRNYQRKPLRAILHDGTRESAGAIREMVGKSMNFLYLEPRIMSSHFGSLPSANWPIQVNGVKVDVGQYLVIRGTNEVMMYNQDVFEGLYEEV